jgi:hypothetical protein
MNKPEILRTERDLKDLFEYIAETGSFDNQTHVKPIKVDIAATMLIGIGECTRSMDEYHEYKNSPLWIQFTVNSHVDGYKVTNQANA